MTKVSFALGLVNHLRNEKNPPLARYCALLSLAENRGRTMTAVHIFRRFGSTPLEGTLDSAARQGLIEIIPAKPAKQYRITPEGEKLVANLLSAASSPIIPV